MTHDVERY